MPTWNYFQLADTKSLLLIRFIFLSLNNRIIIIDIKLLIKSNLYIFVCVCLWVVEGRFQSFHKYSPHEGRAFTCFGFHHIHRSWRCAWHIKMLVKYLLSEYTLCISLPVSFSFWNPSHWISVSLSQLHPELGRSASIFFWITKLFSREPGCEKLLSVPHANIVGLLENSEAVRALAGNYFVSLQFSILLININNGWVVTCCHYVSFSKAFPDHNDQGWTALLQPLCPHSHGLELHGSWAQHCPFIVEWTWASCVSSLSRGFFIWTGSSLEDGSSLFSLHSLSSWCRYMWLFNIEATHLFTHRDPLNDVGLKSAR